MWINHETILLISEFEKKTQLRFVDNSPSRHFDQTVVNIGTKSLLCVCVDFEVVKMTTFISY